MTSGPSHGLVLAKCLNGLSWWEKGKQTENKDPIRRKYMKIWVRKEEKTTVELSSARSPACPQELQAPQGNTHHPLQGPIASGPSLSPDPGRVAQHAVALRGCHSRGHWGQKAGGWGREGSRQEWNTGFIRARNWRSVQILGQKTHFPLKNKEFLSNRCDGTPLEKWFPGLENFLLRKFIFNIKWKLKLRIYRHS